MARSFSDEGFEAIQFIIGEGEGELVMHKLPCFILADHHKWQYGAAAMAMRLPCRSCILLRLSDA